MEQTLMLAQMCHQTLSRADINAIRKARGLEKEVSSPSSLEAFFLTSIGVKQAVSTLSESEAAGLHLLLLVKEDVDISFFERMYGCNSYAYTVTQRYRDTLNEVKNGLVRKGLLVMAESKTRAETVQMERWRFRFPTEFAEFLPPLVPNPQVFPPDGARTETAKIRRLILNSIVHPERNDQAKTEGMIAFQRGSFTLGGKPFTLELQQHWRNLLWHIPRLHQPDGFEHSLTVTDAIRQILTTLKPGEGARPEDLHAAVSVFCAGSKFPPIEKICQAGWEWGCLIQRRQAGERFYSLPNFETESDPLQPSDYLEVNPEGNAVIVDLETIPMIALEQLNAVARFKLTGPGILALTDPKKISRASSTQRQTVVANWLTEHVPAFREVFEAVERQWGKILLHNNLLVAHVKDLSLRVQIERQLGGDVILLNEEYIAFPAGLRTDVEKVVKKAGFVTREVSA